MLCKWNKTQTGLISTCVLASEEQNRLKSEGLNADNFC